MAADIPNKIQPREYSKGGGTDDILYDSRADLERSERRSAQCERQQAVS